MVARAVVRAGSRGAAEGKGGGVWGVAPVAVVDVWTCRAGRVKGAHHQGCKACDYLVTWWWWWWW